MPNEDDALGRDKVLRDLFVEGVFLWNAIPLEIIFLAMDQVVLESEWIVGLDGSFVFVPAAAVIQIQMCGMMVNHDDHAPRLVCTGRFPQDFGFLQKLAQPGNIFHFQVMAARALEERALRADQERKLVVSVRLDLANLLNQFNYGSPGEVSRQFAANKTLKQFFVIVTEMRVHPASISPPTAKCWSGLLRAGDARGTGADPSSSGWTST
jgi:hypothetical protein